MYQDKIDELREAGKDHKKLAEIAEIAKEKLGLTEHQMDALKNWKDKSSHASTMEGVKDLKESLAALKTKDVMERLKRTKEALKAGQNDPRSEL
jgi:hypothetical protein